MTGIFFFYLNAVNCKVNFCFSYCFNIFQFEIMRNSNLSSNFDLQHIVFKEIKVTGL